MHRPCRAAQRSSARPRSTVAAAPGRLPGKRRPRGGNAMREPLRIARQGCFFTGGRYRPHGEGPASGQAMLGQMFVQFQVPAELRRPHPVVMIHGGGQTGTNFTAPRTAGRGWADDFLRAGLRGLRRGPAGAGPLGQFDDAQGPYSRDRHDPDRAALHGARATPSSGRRPRCIRNGRAAGRPGDPVFDQFYASQVASTGGHDADRGAEPGGRCRRCSTGSARRSC